MVKNIMVVDDNPDVVNVVKQGLEYIYPSEYKVICAKSGKKCFELLEKYDSIPDVILLDIMMPDMNGWEVFDRLKLNPSWKDIPIIFLSGRADRVAKSAGRFLGDDYIEKPFEIMDLKNRIDKILQHK